MTERRLYPEAYVALTEQERERYSAVYDEKRRELITKKGRSHEDAHRLATGWAERAVRRMRPKARTLSLFGDRG